MATASTGPSRQVLDPLFKTDWCDDDPDAIFQHAIADRGRLHPSSPRVLSPTPLEYS
jgi:hypothetical protein